MSNAKDALNGLIDDFTTIARDLNRTVYEMKPETLDEEKPVWAGIYCLLLSGINFKYMPIRGENYIQYELSTRALFYKIVDDLNSLMQESGENKSSEFYQILADKGFVRVLTYLLFIDSMDRQNIFQQPEYQPLADKIMESAHCEVLKEAFDFIQNRADETNRFAQWQAQINADISLVSLISVISKIELKSLDLPDYIYDLISSYFVVELLKKIIKLPHQEMRHLILSSINMAFYEQQAEISTVEQEFEFYSQHIRCAEKQQETHNIYTFAKGLWRQQQLALTEIQLAFYSQLLMGFKLSDAQSIEQGRRVHFLLEKLRSAEYQLTIITEQDLWKNIFTLFVSQKAMPSPLLMYYFQNALTLSYGLLKHAELGRLFVVSSQCIEYASLGLTVLENKDIFELFFALFGQLKVKEDLNPITQLNVCLALEKKPEESEKAFALRYLLNILMQATAQGFEKASLDKIINLVEKLSKSLPDEYRKDNGLQMQLTLLKGIITYTRDCRQFQSMDAHDSDSLRKMDRLCQKLLPAFFDQIDEKVMFSFRKRLLLYLIKIAEIRLKKDISQESHGKLIAVLSAYQPIFKLLNVSEKEHEALKKVYQVEGYHAKIEKNCADLIADEKKSKQQSRKKKQEAAQKRQIDAQLAEEKAARAKQKAEEKAREKALALEKQKAEQAEQARKKREEEAQNPQPIVEEKKLKQKNKNRKKKKAAQAVQQKSAPLPSPPRQSPLVSAQSFFPCKRISRDRLPEALLALSDCIRDITGNDLILTGGAVASIYLNESDIKDFDCLIHGISLEELKIKLAEAGYENLQIQGKDHPVLSFKTHGIEIEISILLVSEGVYAALKEDAKTRDIVYTAMYLIINRQPVLEIHDPLKGKKALKERKIPLNPIPGFFEADPIRLLRVLKEHLKRPNFQLDDESKATLMKIDQPSLWKHYLEDKYRCHRHRGKTITALRNLFNRFAFRQILEKMPLVNLVQGLTGLDEKQLDSCLKLQEAFPAEDTLYAFYLVTAAVFFQSQEGNRSVIINDWPLFPLIPLDKRLDNFTALKGYYIQGVKMDFPTSQEAMQVISWFSNEMGRDFSL